MNKNLHLLVGGGLLGLAMVSFYSVATYKNILEIKKMKAEIKFLGKRDSQIDKQIGDKV